MISNRRPGYCSNAEEQTDGLPLSPTEGAAGTFDPKARRVKKPRPCRLRSATLQTGLMAHSKRVGGRPRRRRLTRPSQATPILQPLKTLFPASDKRTPVSKGRSGL